MLCERANVVHSVECLQWDELVDAQLRVFASGAMVCWMLAALTGCSDALPAASPSPSPSTLAKGAAYEEMRQANADFVECVESHGATVTVNEIDDFGVPDISNSVAWPRLSAEPGTPERDAELEQYMDWYNDCESTTVGPVRQAYWAADGRSAVQQANRDLRWREKLPQVRDCFTKAGAYTDGNTSRDELMTIYRNADDTVAFDQCLIDAGLVTLTGDGTFQLDF